MKHLTFTVTCVIKAVITVKKHQQDIQHCQIYKHHIWPGQYGCVMNAWPLAILLNPVNPDHVMAEMASTMIRQQTTVKSGKTMMIQHKSLNKHAQSTEKKSDLMV